MGKGRAPCCDKSKVKRGPWSPEEDLKLIAFIQKHGHQNWRSLPIQAGLVRCGKSCRLRWINYLRPDVKRGHFTKEEEETIIKLHEAFGNKWSKIASHLPGRTDNEIKNVWNTHLKKKFFKRSTSSDQSKQESSSLTSSSSSSSSNIENQLVTTLMAQKTNNNKEQNSENHVSNIKESSPTSVYSTVSTPTQEVQDGEELTAPGSPFSCTLENEVVDDATRSSGLLEIPFEADYDFWNMLDDDNIGLGGRGPFASHDHQETETRKWLHELEKELGLEPQAFDLEMNTIGSYDLDIWPSWPNI